MRDIATANEKSTRVESGKTKPTAKTASILSDERECDKKHPNIPCAANDGPHYPAYLDSGAFDKRCDSCKALLLASEILHSKSSSICCRFCVHVIKFSLFSP